jgi:hypothetical protein
MTMNKWLLAVVTVAVLTPSPAFAWHEFPPLAVVLDWPGYNAYPAGTTFKKVVVSGEHAHWYQQQVPTVVPRITYREDVTKVKTWVNVPTVVDEKQSALAYVPVPRLVEKEVTTCVMLPIFLTDPSGKPVFSCRPEIKAHKISYTVWDYKLVVKTYPVKVTRMIPQEKIIEYKQTVPVVVYDQQLTTQWRVMQVPYQKVVTVPTYDPNNAPSTFWP